MARIYLFVAERFCQSLCINLRLKYVLGFEIIASCYGLEEVLNMLYTLNDLEQYTVNAADGYVGKIKDFYFDDRTWKLRYLVVETGIWLKNRKVLLPASAVKLVNKDDKQLSLDMSMYHVKNGPSIERDLSLKPQSEIDYLSYYGYSFYRGATEAHGFDKDAEAKLAEIFASVDAVRRTYGDRHLRSCKEMINYDIEGSDSQVGYLQSMLFDEKDWSVRYLMLNTSNWWLGHQVLLEPQSIRDVSWGDARIYVNMLRQEIQSTPIFDADTLNSLDEGAAHLHERDDNIFDKQPLFKLV